MAHAEESLLPLISKIAAEHGYYNPQIITNEISSGGANYTSRLFTVIVRETNRDDLHLFAKVVKIGEKFRSKVPLTIFNTELITYTKLWKIYQALEEENQVPEEHKLLFTKCYGCDPTLYKEVLVLENLLEQGFGPYNRFESVDWEYASAAITELTKLHALSFVYSEKYPTKFEKFLDDIKLVWQEGMLDIMTGGSVVTALQTVGPEHREPLERYLNIYMKDLLERFFAPIRRTVIVHGDYRGSNMLHRKRKLVTVSTHLGWFT